VQFNNAVSSCLKFRWDHPEGGCFIHSVTTCLENLEMSGNLTAVRKMSGILLKVRKMSGKICLKLFIIGCMFVSMRAFSRSLFCVEY